jgi:hypothetical protein
MYALRRDEVDDLNQRARARLDSAGHLGAQRLTAAGREFAAGDEVLCLRNDRRLGVRNGTRSIVTAVDPAERTVTLADGTVLPAAYLDAGHLGYALCTTIHKAQGATVDQAFLLGSDALYREAGYVGLSRARHGTHLYVVAPGPSRGDDLGDPMGQTIRLLAKSQAQTLALDQLDRPELPTGRQTEREALLADPPEWALQALGPPPVTAGERDSWSRAAGRISAYRDIYAITDPTDALGPTPTDRHQRDAWELAHLAVEEHQRSLEHEREGLHL